MNRPNRSHDDLLSARILKCYEEPDDTPWFLLLILCAAMTLLLWAYFAWPAVLPVEETIITLSTERNDRP